MAVMVKPTAPRISRLLVIAAALVTAASGVLFGRDVEIIVKDTELNLPLEGAVIRSWDGSEYICDAEGRAVLPAPDDRQAVIRAAYPGYENGRLAIPVQGNQFSLGLSLSGVMEGRELVVEASRPEQSETKTGRSVGISGEALRRTAEIGMIEDVMTSVKLLPGVGYTGMFNARPSIRGGEPGDLTAALDGFYIANPYHWGGGFSIFDPRMVESVRLSHGVFSTRYGHTISGLLEVSSRRPNSSETELELGFSTSTANLSLSVPLWGKGGVMVMGRVTYYDPFVWAAQALLSDSMPELNAITAAPYIRSTTITANYRFGLDLEWKAAAFLGADGVGADYVNGYDQPGIVKGSSHMVFNWTNLQGFVLSGLTWNPGPRAVLKTSLGAGFLNQDLGGEIRDEYDRWYSGSFWSKYEPVFSVYLPGWTPPAYYHINRSQEVEMTNRTANVQGRLDFDWQAGEGLLFAAGLQELYSHWDVYQSIDAYGERLSKTFYGGTEVFYGPGDTKIFIPAGNEMGLYVSMPVKYHRDGIKNGGFTTSAYALAEYTSPDRRFGAEAGLRVDHFYMKGDGFTLQSYAPYDYRSLNPRLNLDYVLLRDRGILDSLAVTAGTGLFSSLNNNVSNYSAKEDIEIPFNRSWTSVGGFKAEFTGGWTFNIEGYFKKVFDRTYLRTYQPPGSADAVLEYNFDGEGRIWGFDFMLQRLESRYWDGWLSYSFNHARYWGVKESPGAAMGSSSGTEENQGREYYPSFHRFHTLNLVLNIKPWRNFTIALRAGLASGQPKPVVGTPQVYPVQIYDENGKPVYDDNGDPVIIEKWKRSSRYSDTERVDWSVPLDVKFSWFISRGKSLTEIYLAVENISSLFYKTRGNTSFNAYTGEEDTGSNAAVYGLPIPMPSVGVKWSY